MKHTEKSIIKRLYTDFENRNHSIMCHNNTNTLYYVGESDFISVTKTGMIHEIEIKISKSDFKNDFIKKKRHEHLSKGYFAFKKILKWQGITGLNWFMGCLELSEKRSEFLPNYFYYAIPEGLIDLDDIPSYCGVIEITEHGTRQIRKPKRIHKEKIVEKQLFSLGRSLTFRNNKCINFHQ